MTAQQRMSRGTFRAKRGIEDEMAAPLQHEEEQRRR